MVWNPLALPPLGCALISFALALLVVTRRRRQPGPSYSPVILCMGVWNACMALLVCTRDVGDAWLYSRVALSSIVVAGPAAMRYVTWFARLPHRGTWRAGSLAVTAVGLALVWFDPGTIEAMRRPSWGGLYPLLGSRAWLFFAIGALGVAVPMLIPLRMWLTLPPSRRRRQAAYVVLGYVAALGAGIDIVGATGGELPPLVWAFGTASVLIFYYATVRWRLSDPRTALHRALLWLIVVAASFAPLYLISQATAHWAGWQQPGTRAFVVFAIMAFLLLWIARVEPLAMALMSRRARRQAQVAEELAALAVGVRRPEEIVPLVDRALSSLAGLRLAAVILEVDVGGQRLEVRLPEGTPPPRDDLEQVLPDEPLGRGELDDDPRGLDSPAAQLLAAYGADALLPLRHQDGVVGVLFVRDDRPAASFDELTREGLRRLAARAAVAFINAALEEALERRSALLEEEVQERTRKLAQAVEDLKGAQAQLVQAERQSSLGLLVAGVSHEINNALNFIVGNLPMMQEYTEVYAELYERASAAGARPRAELVREAQRARQGLPDILDGIGHAAERARGIVADLRRFARRDDADSKKPTDVRENLASTLNLLRAELAGRIEVERRFADELPLIDGYPSALNHVFLNVLLNAVQAISSEDGGPGRILVEATAGADSVEIRVHDSGPGVPEADRARVFAPFYSTRPRAAGLGLAVCRQLVERHGGAIRLEGSPALPGACVAIALPRVVM